MKIYMKPQSVVVNLFLEDNLLQASGEKTSAAPKLNNSLTTEPQLSNRKTWGSKLWEYEE